jgi:bacteriocin-like protein
MKNAHSFQTLDITDCSLIELNDSELNEIIGGDEMAEKVSYFAMWVAGYVTQTVNNIVTLTGRLAEKNPYAAASLPAGY